MSFFVGIDPGSRHAGLAAIHEDGTLKTQVIHPTGTVPARLVQLRHEARHWLSRLADEGCWACVVERPVTKHGGATLLASYGVLLEVAQASLDCPVMDLGSGEWKARLKVGRASPDEVMAHARALGYSGASLDAAVAVCCADVARGLSERVRGAA